jgi:N-acetylglucosaminyldiphosphoundecaprenol N-acetyl-beta-D-mannosaminyltransferase
MRVSAPFIGIFASVFDMAIQRTYFLGLPLDTGVTLEDVCGFLQDVKKETRFVTFVSPQAWAIARRQPEYRSALNQMSFVLPDGEAVAHACRWVTGLPVRRISFDLTSLAEPFFAAAEAAMVPLMLVGGDPGVDESMQEELKKKYTDLKIVGTAHGFGDQASKIADVMARKAKVVVVSMEPVHQENFMIALREAGFKGLAISCNDLFGYYIKPETHYPQWIDRLNLRSIWRLYKEPGKLWRRYLVDYPYYFGLVIWALAEKYAFPWLSEKARHVKEETVPLMEKVSSRMERARKK